MGKTAFYKHVFDEKVKKILLNYPTLNYLQRVWRYRKDADFVDRVMRINHDPNVLELRAYGEKNSDKNIYLLQFSDSMGLGGYLRRVFYLLAEAETLGFVPVVSMQSEDCPYLEKEPVLGTRNPFEYYFEALSDISVEEAYQSKRVFLFSKGHEIRIEYDLGNQDATVGGGYDLPDEYFSRLADLTKKYIRTNAKTTEFIRESKDKLFPTQWDGRRILGVHIRGTDYALNWYNHPNMVDTDEFITMIDTVIKEDGGFDYIFLATDDELRLEKMKAYYGDKLLYYIDVHRGSGTINIAEEKNERPFNAYLNGLEVVRDMYTLADCDGLICGLSQVSFMARVIRLSRGIPYRRIEVLDKGIYRG